MIRTPFHMFRPRKWMEAKGYLSEEVDEYLDAVGEYEKDDDLREYWLAKQIAAKDRVIREKDILLQREKQKVKILENEMARTKESSPQEGEFCHVLGENRHYDRWIERGISDPVPVSYTVERVEWKRTVVSQLLEDEGNGNG